MGTAAHSTPLLSGLSVPRLESIRRYLGRAQQSVQHSVLESSRKTYGTGIRRWLEFVKIFGTDPLMQVIHPEFMVQQSDLDAAIRTSWQEACIMGYLEWLQCPPHKIAPKTAFGYLCAVRYYLIGFGVDLKSMSQLSIAKQKQGLLNDFLMDEANSEANTRTIPLSVDIIQGERPTSYRSCQDLAFYTAMSLGFTILSRVSNYLPQKSAAYVLNTEHVTFLVRPVMESTCEPFDVSADQIVGIPLDRIVGCSVFLQKSKVDSSGIGKRFPFSRHELCPPHRVYDIVSDLYQYVQAVQPIRGQPFFHVPGLQWSLVPTEYNSRLRKVAIKHGLDPNRVHSHSIRIGGATVLAAAGIPDYVIMTMGGWASAVYLQYIRPSLQVFDSAQTALADATVLSASSIRSMHPNLLAPAFDRSSYPAKLIKDVFGDVHAGLDH